MKVNVGVESIENLRSKVIEIKEKRQDIKRPIIVEFTGSPESGKTTSINYMVELFQSLGINVLKLREPAEYCPIVKKCDEDKVKFNDWTFKESVNNILKVKNTKNLDIVLCDRGVWDNLVWYKLYEDLGLITNEHYNRLFFNERIGSLVDIMYILKTSPQISIERKGGKQGKVVNEEFLTKYNSFIDKSLGDFKDNIHSINLINTDEFKDVNNFKNFVAYKLLDDIFKQYCDKNLVRKMSVTVTDIIHADKCFRP